MGILLGLIVLAAALAALAYPLYQSRPRAQFASTGLLTDLLAQRDGVYATLRDLDLDYQLGKLDEADYQARREKYVNRAALLLEQLDSLRGSGPTQQELSQEIEREVAALRAKKKTVRTTRTSTRRPASNGHSPAPHIHPPAEAAPVLACANCGREYKSGDRFCANCGQALS